MPPMREPDHERQRHGEQRQHRRVGQRAEHLQRHRPLGRDRAAEITVQHVPQPDDVLHRDRPVEAVGVLDDRDRLRRRVRRQHRLQRVARRQIHQREADDADPERDRDGEQDAAQDVAAAIRRASVSGSTVIGVRSWNQLCACTKPCTLGDSARGLRSCTTKIISACVDSYSCSLVSRTVRLAGSNSSKTSFTSSSASGVRNAPSCCPPATICAGRPA